MNSSVSVMVILQAVFLVPLPSARSEVATGVALKGSVRFVGKLPRGQHVSMTADPVCSRSHPNGADLNEVAADAQGDLAGVVVYISSGAPPSDSAAAPAPVTLEQEGCMYRPAVVAVQATQKLKIVNDDQTMHNIHALPRNNREWNQAQVPGSVALEKSFAREEIGIPVKCNVHPWMRGYVAVFNNPYFAVTPANGRFEIRNLAPGQYTVTAWHEKLGSLSQKISVNPGQPAVADFVLRSAPALGQGR